MKISFFSSLIPFFLLFLTLLPISAHRSHSHHSNPHPTPASSLNQSIILLSHAPTPLSYLAYDQKLVIIDPSTGALAPNPNPHFKPHPLWIILHAVGMSLAWFVSLPLALATSYSQNPWPSLIFRSSFILLLLLSLLSGIIYRSLTPNLYEHQKHSILGWLLVAFACLSSLYQSIPLWYKFKSTPNPTQRDQYHPILETDDPSPRDSESSSTGHKSHPYFLGQDNITKSPILWREIFSKLFFSFFDRLLILLASVATVTGAVIYTGICRAEYINGCLAHFIKGGIFFWYGILNWTRYLGGYPELGWPWHQVANKIDGSPSAEMVESLVVFLYGITNVWMERFGSRAGEPYTVKQVQHISIAAMFAFGGLVGILLETPSVRQLLFGRRETPTSNPFPTLCITITGLAMSAHLQEYQFQVSIHTLWGTLLGLFGVMRWMTYAVDREERGPPVTEALGSLFLISGGAVFMESVEEITFSAMRHQFDDVMAFLNVTVALACLVMAWTTILMTIKRKMS